LVPTDYPNLAVFYVAEERDVTGSVEDIWPGLLASASLEDNDRIAIGLIRVHLHADT
jgi:hypothetical protein